jgi:hypothetical protein
MERGQLIRWAVPAVLVVVVVVVFVWISKPKRAGVGELGADGVCRAPLGRYCDRSSLPLPIRWSSRRCRSYAEYLEAAKNGVPLREAGAGTCGDLRWVQWSSGFEGEIAYFDVTGALVCVESWADYYGSCSGKSPTLVYGSRPSCERHTELKLKEPGTE